MNGNSKNSTQKEGFDGSRKDMNTAIDHMCEFTGMSNVNSELYNLIHCRLKNSVFSLFLPGTKTIFWDLREPIIDGLYRPSVAQSRLENVIEPLDLV